MFLFADAFFVFGERYNEGVSLSADNVHEPGREKESYERQDFQCTSAGGTKLYASYCHPAGSGAFALGIGSSFTNATTIATYGLQGILGAERCFTPC